MAIEFDNETFALVPQAFAMPRLERTGGRDSRVSPIEEAGAILVHELRRVGWDVPGLDLAFSSHGRGTEVTRKLTSVSGTTEEGPFRLRFGGSTGEVRGGFWTSTQLNHAVVPPGIDVHYFSDGSGPSVELMVRGDWREDGAAFMGGHHVNSKLNGESKTYLKYTGGRGRGGGDWGTLVHDADLGREYEPEGDEPRSLDGAELARQVNDFVMGIVARLKAMPSARGHDDVTDEGDANLRRLAAVERIPVPAGFPTLYVRAERNDIHGAARRQATGASPEPERDYVLSGSGWRLVTAGMSDARIVHPRATDGFCYAVTDPSCARGHVIYAKPLSDTMAVEVRPTCLNDIFVVDNAAHAEARAESVEKAISEGRDRLTGEEVRSIALALVRTMVPAAEYDGSYAEPVYLIGRQMGVDEARVMRGPVRVAMSGEGVVAVMRDTATDEPVVLFESDEARLWDLRQAVRSARDASEILGVRVRVDGDVEEALEARESAHKERLASPATP